MKIDIGHTRPVAGQVMVQITAQEGTIPAEGLVFEGWTFMALAYPHYAGEKTLLVRGVETDRDTAFFSMPSGELASLKRAVRAMGAPERHVCSACHLSKLYCVQADGWYCPDDSPTMCSRCGAPGGNGHNGMCETCWLATTAECSLCHTRVERDGMIAAVVAFTGRQGVLGNICRDCYLTAVTPCQGCRSRVVTGVIREGLCPRCWATRGGVQEYQHTRANTFYGEPKDGLYLGIELEVDGSPATERDETSKKLWALCRSWDLFICKHDGSLGTRGGHRGFEIATQPCSLAYHQKEFPWDAMLEIIRADGWFGEEIGGAGLHIHISRGPISRKAQVLMAGLVYNNPSHMARLARREACPTYSKWKELGPLDENVTDTNDRYEALNLSNPNTIEWRMFNSTTKAEDLIATIEFVHAATTFCMLSKVERAELAKGGSGWHCLTDFVSKTKGYEQLMGYLTKRGLR